MVQIMKLIPKQFYEFILQFNAQRSAIPTFIEARREEKYSSFDGRLGWFKGGGH
jgi:hypothetical protein